MEATRRRAAAALGIAAAVAAGLLGGCDHDQQQLCGDGTTVCDDQGVPLVYAPDIIPAYGIYGHPGYVAPVTVYPGAPHYHVTYVNKPPNYAPPVAPLPPPANPGNAKPAAPVKPAAPPGYKPPVVKAPTVRAPTVKAPTVRAPSINAPKPAPAPKPPAPARSSH